MIGGLKSFYVFIAFVCLIGGYLGGVADLIVNGPWWLAVPAAALAPGVAWVLINLMCAVLALVDD